MTIRVVNLRFSLNIPVNHIHTLFFSSAVPSGRGAFQMPTRPSSAASAASAVSASTLRGGRANLRNSSVTFSLFFGMKLLWDNINNIS